MSVMWHSYNRRQVNNAKAYQLIVVSCDMRAFRNDLGKAIYFMIRFDKEKTAMKTCDRAEKLWPTGNRLGGEIQQDLPMQEFFLVPLCGDLLPQGIGQAPVWTAHLKSDSHSPDQGIPLWPAVHRKSGAKLQQYFQVLTLVLEKSSSSCDLLWARREG